MTPIEKAKELKARMKVRINDYDHFRNGDNEQLSAVAKACALICVEEIMHDKYECSCEQSVVINGKYETYVTYWQQVKTEIENL